MAHVTSTRLFAIAGAVALATLTALAQSTLTGTWALDVDSPQGASKVNLVVAVNGDTATGRIASDMGETPFSGTVKDGTLTFSFDFAGPQGPMTITTTATVTGDEMTGQMDYGMGVAPFTGKRAGP